MWHRVDVVLTDVSEESITPTFRVEEQVKRTTNKKLQPLFPARFLLGLIFGPEQ
jgi:hypothetical protein